MKAECVKKEHSGWRKAYHGLINGVCDFVREDATGQARHNLGDARVMGCLQYVVVDSEVVTLWIC